jgi:hypothetical protein
MDSQVLKANEINEVVQGLMAGNSKKSQTSYAQMPDFNKETKDMVTNKEIDPTYKFWCEEGKSSRPEMDLIKPRMGLKDTQVVMAEITEDFVQHIELMSPQSTFTVTKHEMATHILHIAAIICDAAKSNKELLL